MTTSQDITWQNFYHHCKLLEKPFECTDQLQLLPAAKPEDFLDILSAYQDGKILILPEYRLFDQTVFHNLVCINTVKARDPLSSDAFTVIWKPSRFTGELVKYKSVFGVPDLELERYYVPHSLCNPFFDSCFCESVEQIRLIFTQMYMGQECRVWNIIGKLGRVYHLGISLPYEKLEVAQAVLGRSVKIGHRHHLLLSLVNSKQSRVHPHLLQRQAE
ncbi:hypothetical protein F5877DRAFT_63970 [Lentinula edodes]|nr:hypothetical protein F5877DRAFT_63970 [Lentinula edodes]